VAIKVINKTFLRKAPQAERNLKTEVSIHKSLDHPRLVKFIDFFDDETNYYMVMELCTPEVILENNF
jgi:serine/threonine protein kinase